MAKFFIGVPIVDNYSPRIDRWFNSIQKLEGDFEVCIIVYSVDSRINGYLKSVIPYPSRKYTYVIWNNPQECRSNRTIISSIYNDIRNRFLKSRAEYLVMMDTVAVQPNILEKLASTIDSKKADVVSPVIRFNGNVMHWVLTEKKLMRMPQNGYFAMRQLSRDDILIYGNGAFRVDVSTLTCTMIRKDVLQDIEFRAYETVQVDPHVSFFVDVKLGKFIHVVDKALTVI